MTKREFDDKYVGEHKYIRCQSHEFSNKFLSLVNKFGYKWRSGNNILDIDPWYVHKMYVIYNVNNEGLAYTHYHNRYMDYNIIIFDYKHELPSNIGKAYR